MNCELASGVRYVISVLYKCDERNHMYTNMYLLTS